MICVLERGAVKFFQAAAVCCRPGLGLIDCLLRSVAKGCYFSKELVFDVSF